MRSKGGLQKSVTLIIIVTTVNKLVVSNRYSTVDDFGGSNTGSVAVEEFAKKYSNIVELNLHNVHILL
jgi:hypothetical protein